MQLDIRLAARKRALYIDCSRSNESAFSSLEEALTELLFAVGKLFGGIREERPRPRDLGDRAI